jgi:hypothetical protein
MTTKENANYFEEPINMLFRGPHPVICKDCKCAPDIFSQREKERDDRVLLLGIKIHCVKCNKSIERGHGRYDTLHPDDATVYVVIKEWNKANENKY